MQPARTRAEALTQKEKVSCICGFWLLFISGYLALGLELTDGDDTAC
jgi:hypothetical protein